MYKKTITDNITNETKIETRYYFTDLNDIHLISGAIRRHCTVENELHWHMDVSLNEGINTIMNNQSINNLSIIKRIH